MGPIHLFDLASRHAHWLATRQTVIAENISHVNTPGYKAGDVAPFEATHDGTGLSLATSDPRHLVSETSEPTVFAVEDAPTWDIHHSGNSVGLEQELMKAADVTRDYSLDRSISKAFNRMLLASLKG